MKFSDCKVIDIAMKYGYNSATSFSRAFTAFHGVTPGTVRKADAALRAFPKITFQISIKEEIDAMRKDKLTVKGKQYDALYFGEVDMSAWSVYYKKREFWRLENAYEDFKDKQKLNDVLPYNNYPPIGIEIGQIFVIDYHKYDGTVLRKYYVSDGSVWNDLICTREIAVDCMPLSITEISVNGKSYIAEYYGEVDMSSWSVVNKMRKFWRLRDAFEDFKDLPFTGEVLPYTNYPPMDIEVGQVFVVDYYKKDSDAVERFYYISDGTAWQGMPTTRRVIL